ncbi:alkaline phosphatase family protein [bacterium]|nr:alkaline phosphatase family protein [bacterium]
MPNTFILGIDGLPDWMWRQFADNGVMPHSAELLDSGTLKPMQSAIPEVSSSAWSSIVTGESAGGHNVFGFTDLIDGSYTMGFTSSRTLKATPFWAKPGAGPNLIMNVPQTYPAQPMEGTLVSGFVALDLKRAVHPAEKLDEFEAINYRVDADMSVIEQSKAAFVDDLRTVLDARCTGLHQQWDDQLWDTIMFVITGTDRLNHYLWEDYADPSSPHHQMFLDFYHEVDRQIHRITERLDDNTTIIAGIRSRLRSATGQRQR